MTIRRALLILLLIPATASAQDTASTALPLSLGDAVARGLEHNLAAVVHESRVTEAAAVRQQTRSELLPHVSANVRQSRQVINTAAFGFSGFGGLPNLIGPFGLFDARLDVSAPLWDLSALNDLRADVARETAARADYHQVRQDLTLAIASLYLQALADRSRVTSAETQTRTAEALVLLALDQKAAGVVAQIDVLRQQVQLESAKAQLIEARNDLEKRKLQLGRAIGLPATQAIELTSSSGYIPLPPPALEAALAEAADHRSDLEAASARAEAARSDRRAAAATALPSVRVNADVGALGADAASALRTYSLAATVHVPLFEGGHTRARVLETDAIAREREAEVAELRQGLAYEIQAALLDLNAATASVGVAQSRALLARDELVHAQDRFRAGVASSIELVQAQDAVARASELEIASVLAHNIAKAGLARAIGGVEDRFTDFIGGQQ